jgi:murein DD-endopeptidase MepM/ murein hydrolase activator NlpD
MGRHRTTARGTFVSLLLAGLAAAALASSSAGAGEQAVPRLVFPLVAKTFWWDNYGDPRPNGHHAGIDIEAPWRAPVVAVEAGRVEYAASRLGGCMLYLYGRSGTAYMYIHLNNDLTSRFDDKGGCVRGVAFEVPNGARVAAGEQVAWNGDSGDAVGNHHLHFEVHPGNGPDVSPFRHLQRAIHPLFTAPVGTPFSLGLRGKLLVVDAATVRLQVELVRYYPGGRWTAIDPRPVDLALAPDAAIAPALTVGAGYGIGRQAAATVPVAAYTLKAKTTTDAILGTTGVLRVSTLSPLR